MSEKKKYTVSANLYSHKANDYVHHWEGQSFDDEDKARDFWNRWTPCDCDVSTYARAFNYQCNSDGGGHDDFDLEIGMWDEEGNEYEFEATGVDPNGIYLEEFSDAVRDRVCAFEWTYKRLAEETGLSVRTIMSYLGHERIPGAVAFRNICNILGINPLEIYFKKEEQA